MICPTTIEESMSLTCFETIPWLKIKGTLQWKYDDGKNDKMLSLFHSLVHSGLQNICVENGAVLRWLGWASYYGCCLVTYFSLSCFLCVSVDTAWKMNCPDSLYFVRTHFPGCLDFCMYQLILQLSLVLHSISWLSMERRSASDDLYVRRLVLGNSGCRLFDERGVK